MAQFSRPSSDISAGSWTPSTGSTLYTLVDETSADDGDYVLTTSSLSEFRVGLSAVSDPGISTGHILRFRHRVAPGASPQGFTFKLRNQSDGSSISSSIRTALDGWTTEQVTLTSGQVASIIDYSALMAGAYADGSTSEVRIAWIELEVPSVASSNIVQIMLQHYGG